MILFDETENKYYELLSYMLHGNRRYTQKDINQLLEEHLPGESDFEVTQTLFALDEREELIFVNRGGYFEPVLKGEFPIRNSTIENQAAKSLTISPYARHFLGEETITKLRKVTEHIKADWSTKDITIKNIFANGISSSDRIFVEEISLIAKAIREKRAIEYDNICPGHVERRFAQAFPVKIEFSVVNDRFRVSAYDPKELRFIKMNLDTMHNIALTDKVADTDLEAEYREFIKLNTRKIIVDVEPIDHMIERCFRLLSYYDRRARYDREGNVYQIEVSYLRADENEIIKNILSMGSRVIVIEPKTIQKEVYRRILFASRQYE